MTTSTPWWRTDSRFSTTCRCRTRGRGFGQPRCSSRTRARSQRGGTDHDRSRDCSPTEPRQSGRCGSWSPASWRRRRRGRDRPRGDRDDDGIDQPSPTVTVPPTVPPQALFGAPDEQVAPGTYFVDEVDGTPTPRIFVTLGAGWTTDDGWGIGKEDVGFMTFSRPDRVFLDACHSTDGFTRGR